VTIIDGMTIIGVQGKTQTKPLAQAVIDSAVMVWMQMGLTNDQIKYGLAALNVEGGFFSRVTNGVSTDTIRGLAAALKLLTDNPQLQSLFQVAASNKERGRESLEVALQ